MTLYHKAVWTTVIRLIYIYALSGPVPACPHLDADDVHEHGEVGEMFTLAHGVGDVSVHHLTAERRPTTVHRPENTTLGYMSICIISYSGKIGDFLQQLKISYERFSPTPGPAPPPPKKKKKKKKPGSWIMMRHVSCILLLEWSTTS